MAEIFLSYRREDAQGATGRLADALEAHFGDDRVFRDREFAPGEDFVAAIRRGIESSTVLLVVIGRHWLDVADARGRRRIDDPDDFVRLEIELGLSAGVAVVPVLVDDARMPAAAQLPPSLAEFARCQAIELSDTRWRYDTEQLIARLQTRFGIGADAPRRPTDRATVAERLSRGVADVFDLASHPTRMIARRQTGRASDPARAFAFLAAAILVGNVLFTFGFDLPRREGGAGFTATARWLFAGELVGLVFVALLAAALALAWRVVHRSAALRRVGVVFSYIYSGASIGVWTGILLFGTAVGLIDQTFFGRLFDAALAATSASAPAAAAPQLRFEDAPYRSAATVLLLLAPVVWLATLAWCVVAWGSFRRALGATRVQAWAATSLWIALIGALLWLGQRLA